MATALEFTKIARLLGDAARAQQLTVPAFRSKYTNQRERRVIRRHAHGDVVAVEIHQDLHPLARDLIDGIVAVNRLTDPEHVEIVRNALWASLERHLAAA